MALSGTFYGTTSNQYIEPKIVWSVSQSISGNYSDVTASLYYSRTNTGYTTSGTLNGAITINGSAKSYSKYVQLTYNSNTLVATSTVRVYHNNDGTKSVTISATGSISGTSLSSTSISKSVTLDTIPRASTPSVATLTLGSSGTINISRASSSFRDTITYKFGSASGTIVTKTSSTSISWTPPLNLANQIPNDTSGVGTLTCTTYNGETKIGSKSISFTAKVPNTVVPTIGSFTSEIVNNSVPSAWGIYVKGKSQCKLKINSPAGAYGSTIKSYSIKQGSTVLASSASVTTPVLNTTGTISFTAIVTDSRGRTATATTSISVVDYFAPVITSVSTERCDENGNILDDGDHILCICSFTFAHCEGCNNIITSVQFRKVGETDWVDGGSFNSGEEKIVSGISPDNTYEVQFTIQDAFDSPISQTIIINTSFNTMDFKKGGHGIAFGKASEKENTFECAFEAEFKGDVTIDGNINRDISSFVWSPNNISTSGQTQTIKKFPSLNVCFFKCYCKTAKQFVAGYSYSVGTVDSEFYPSYLTPLCVYVSGHKNADAWVESDGKIYVYARETISSDISVYINGTWMPK